MVRLLSPIRHPKSRWNASRLYLFPRKFLVFLVVWFATFKALRTGYDVAQDMQYRSLMGNSTEMKRTMSSKTRHNVRVSIGDNNGKEPTSFPTPNSRRIPSSSRAAAAPTTAPTKLYPKPTIHTATNGLPITAENHVNEFQRHLDPHTVSKDRNNLCLPWTTNGDEWWNHHPEWEIALGSENDTHYCFQRVPDAQKCKVFRDLYKIQFPIDNNCMTVFTKRSWDSGWGADFSNLVDGMHHALLHRRPVQVVEDSWHYAGPDPYQKEKPACPRQNMFCYFLPISSCVAAEQGDETAILEERPRQPRYQWYYEYLTRQQTWLRKRIYDMKMSVDIATPCTVMHVRRADVVLHKDFSRCYHPISEYVNSTSEIRPNIFLLTDDQNAIEEALTEFPNYNWQYLDRPRHRGAEGGWENQIPSKDPAFEVTALLTELQLATQYCDQIIRSTSSFADLLFAAMADTGRGVDYVDIDNAYSIRGEATYGENLASAVNISKAYH